MSKFILFFVAIAIMGVTVITSELFGNNAGNGNKILSFIAGSISTFVAYLIFSAAFANALGGILFLASAAAYIAALLVGVSTTLVSYDIS